MPQQSDLGCTHFGPFAALLNVSGSLIINVRTHFACRSLLFSAAILFFVAFVAQNQISLSPSLGFNGGFANLNEVGGTLEMQVSLACCWRHAHACFLLISSFR